MRKLVDDLQQENWRLRVQVAHLQGDRITKDRKGRATFQTPTRRQARAANRRSRRTLQQLDAHLYAIWEIVEASDAEWWSVEGFENLIFTLIRRGLPGSGARHMQRFITKRLLRLLWDDAHCRHWLEKIRAETKIWTPNEFNVAQRQGHAGQRQWRAGRKFMGRQMYGTDTLRSDKRESADLANLWMPITTGFDEPVSADEVGTDAAVAAARSRARKSQAREEAQRKQLRNRAAKDLEKAEEREAERMREAEESPLSSFEAAGTALLLRNEPTKVNGRKVPLPKRRAAAAKAWSQGGEAGPDETRVFEGAEVHHLVLFDRSYARNSAEAMLGFQKLLVSDHEVFTDELHMAPAAKGKGLSYHALDSVALLHEPPEKPVRLQVGWDRDGIGMG